MYILNVFSDRSSKQNSFHCLSLSLFLLCASFCVVLFVLITINFNKYMRQLYNFYDHILFYSDGYAFILSAFVAKS